MSKRLAFVGAGAVGSYIGGLISAAGEDVTLIDPWPDHVNAIKETGLRVSGTQGEHHAQPQALHINEVQGLIKSPIDIAFICTKSYDTAWASHLIRDYIVDGGFAVSIQNGINEDTIAGALGRERVLGCIASNIGVGIVGPGHVTRTAAAGGKAHTVFRVGEMDGNVTSRVEEVAGLLQIVDSTKVTTNLNGERWSKLVANSMGNGLQAITGLSSREMAQTAEVRRLTIRLAAEAVEVGQALGLSLVPIGGKDPQVWLDAGRGRGLEELELSIMQAAERYEESGRSSTAQDMEKGRRLEIEYLNGLVVARGREAGVDVSLNEGLVTKVKAVERGEIEVGLKAAEGLS